ncbi:MAG: hypothetical protein JWQ34_1689 [Mucilaginibacter sp.]|uniref:DUF4369 domain-containing protein n=1 Tax=Mucilaginibacter sp. TaxID=1882438 RepID=UPI002634204E|nr:DUF4369 domain-containing protein [Mucilaginibacter sp.]MDB5003464.1 hypothetical protein [Mucilaginibacter sp.]
MKILLFLLVTLTLGTGVTYPQQKKTTNNFTLTGHISGKQTLPIWFRYPDGNGKIIQQKVTVKNNLFVIMGYTSSPANVEFSNDFEPNGRIIKNYFGDLFIGPGAITVLMTGDDLSSAKIIGSMMQDDWNKLEQQKQPLYKVRDSLNKEMWKLSSAGNTPKNHEAHMLVGHKVNICDEQLKQADYKFIITHSNSYLSAYLTNYYYDWQKIKADSAKIFYNTFTTPVKYSVSGRLLQKGLAK